MANCLGAIVDPKKLKPVTVSPWAGKPAANTSYIDQNGVRKPGVFQGPAAPQGATVAPTATMARSGGVDYAGMMNSGMANGASYKDIQNWYDARNDKLQSDPSLGKWQNQEFDDKVERYIAEGKRKEQAQRVEDFYAQQAAAAAAAQRAKVELAVGQLGSQKEQVGQSYADLFGQLALEKRMAEKNLPQQMAAMGYTGGLSENAAMGLATNYAEALRKGEQGRIGSLSELDRAIEETRFTGDIAMAEQASKLAQDKFSTYSELMRQQQEQANLDRQYGYTEKEAALGHQQWQQQYTDEKDYRDDAFRYDKESAEAKNVWNMLNSGFMPSDSLLALAGLSRADAEEYTKYLREQMENSGKAAEKSGGNTYQMTDNGGSAVLEAEKRFNSGDRSPEVIQALLAGGYTAEDLQTSGYQPQKPGFNMLDASKQQMQETEKPKGMPSMNAQKLAIKFGNPNLGQYQKLNMIQTAYQAGEISKADADGLLQFIGA